MHSIHWENPVIIITPSKSLTNRVKLQFQNVLLEIIYKNTNRKHIYFIIIKNIKIKIKPSHNSEAANLSQSNLIPL